MEMNLKNKVVFRFCWILGSVLIPLFAWGSEPGTRQRPLNIIFVFSDDHAYQALGAYGSVINQTPHLDRLAASGMRFDRCLVTNSICGPSRATILTGKYSHSNGFRQNGDHFDGHQLTFPKLLQKAGFQTALFGKWHLSGEPTGFDQWMVLPDQGEYYNPDFLTSLGKQRVEGYVTDILTKRALDWMKNERNPQQPFLLMLQHKAPHRDWMPSLSHLRDFQGEVIREPATLFDDYSNRAGVLQENEMTIARHLRPDFDLKIWNEGASPPEPYSRRLNRLTPEQRAEFSKAYADENRQYRETSLDDKERTRYYYQRYLKDYLRCIASVDDSVGRLLDYLKESGLDDQTIVVYSSDQGFFLGEHGWYDKRWIFEESLRTPLLVRWPGVTLPNSNCQAIVSNLDFAPTFLEMAGLSAPPEMQGKSLTPWLRGETPKDWRKSFYYHYYELHTHHVAAHYGVVTDRYKLVHYYQRLDSNNRPERIDQWDLLDRQVDPLELKSFIDDPSYSTVLADLQNELAILRATLNVSD